MHGNGSGSLPPSLNPPSLAARIRAAGDGKADLPGTEINVSFILRALRAHFMLVGAVVAVVLGATAYLVRETQAVYKATAVVRIANARRAMTSGIEELEPTAERLASPLLSEIQMIKSRTLVGEVVDSLGLRLRPRFKGFSAALLKDVYVDGAAANDSVYLTFAANGFSVRIHTDSASALYGDKVRVPGLELVVAARPEVPSAVWNIDSREAAIEDVIRNLKVTPRTQTNVVDITYTAERRVIAKQVATGVAERFQALSAAAARDQSRRRRIFLEGQLHQSDSAYSAAQLALSSHRRGAAVYSSRTQLEGAQHDAMRLDSRREALEAERRTHDELLTSLQDADDIRRRDGVRVALASPTFTDNPVVMQLSTQLLRQRTAHDSLTTGPWRSAQTNPDVLRLKTLIRGVEEQLIAAVRSRVTALDAELGSLDIARSRSAATLRQMPAVESQEIRLTQLVTSIERRADALRGEYQRARMAEAVEVGPVEIVDRAALPAAPVPEMRGLKLFLGLILGVGLGGGAAFVLEARTAPMRRREEVEQALRLPSLGLIPRIQAEAPQPSALPLKRFANALGSGSRFGFEPKPKVSEAASGTAAALSPAKEAYRILRTNLLFSQHPARMRSIAITSAAPGEGKTTVAVNLAIAFAQGGAKVLLIDADLRRSRLHRMFRTERSPGLAEIVNGEVAVATIQPTGIRNLFLMPSGDPRAAAATVIGEEALRGLLASLEEQFDLVVIDTPPVLALADASVVAATTDTALFVVHAGRTPRGIAQQALQQLEVVGARMAGTVVNDPAGVLPEYLCYYDAYAPA